MPDTRPVTIVVPVPGPDGVSAEQLGMCSGSLMAAFTGTGLRALLFHVSGHPLGASEFQRFHRQINEALDGSGVRVLTLQRRDGDTPPPEVLARVAATILGELRKAMPEYEWSAKAKG